MSQDWVCPECGLDYDTVSPRDAAAAVRSFPRRYRELLDDFDDDEDGDDLIRQRPDATTWSALEYTAHVADLLELFGPILRRMTLEDHPTLDFFDSDARAEEKRYNEAAPDMVLARLEAASKALAKIIDGIDPSAWDRTATFPWGDRDALTTARNAVHEGSHHLGDVEKVLELVA